MIKNYLKIAWRNLLHNKVYSLLNIWGLAAGMAVALIIGLWVNYQYSYDQFLPGNGQLYQVMRNYNSNGDTLTFSSTSLKLADALRHNIPEFAHVAETDGWGAHGLMVGNKKFYWYGVQAGCDFLKMFRYPFIYGNADAALKDPFSIVLTESTAKALFGNTDPINKLIRVDNHDNLKVTGVIKDIPANSTFQFKYVIPFSYYEATQRYVKMARTGSFGNNSFAIYAELKPGVSLGAVSAKIRDIEKGEKDNINAMNSNVILYPMLKWHLFSDFKNGKAASGFIDYVRIFTLIGALVLLIACINFINLSTARSEKRAREVGVRKAIGSQRKDLIFQFLIESSLVTFISFLFSILLVQLALPAFNSLTGTLISIPYANPVFWIFMLVCVSLTGIMAGSRPAFYLSSFNPVRVLKGAIQVGKSASVSRKILVVTQFSCSIALIISTAIIYRQIQYAKDRPIGYQVSRLMATDMNADLARNFNALKNDLLQTGAVTALCTSSSPATTVWSHTDVDMFPGKRPGETVEMGSITVSDDYFKTLGMQMQSGRDFVPGSKADTSNVIFNAAAIKRLRLDNPVNQLITWGGQKFRIIGVVKDALMNSPYSAADPTMFTFSANGPNGNLLYQLSPKMNAHAAVEKISPIFNKYNPVYPYDYRFVDKQYNEKFSQEELIGKLAGIFAVLAIFISCLGLFGLAAFVAEQRTKEIGIRKVLGASVSQVWLLLSGDFILLVTISCVIASPLAFYFLQKWLLKYDYHITIGPGVFIISAIAAIVITLITISFQAIKAAIANPVKSLRSE
ncbi:ABC transporter permease [Mucilaginibacter gotjawali]|uniref:Macrolide export ATP-binding/permease protein MacB n=2 Tax=Mucilaginibacter gotjawali TaxID=1550579 RepID=A0A0X8X6K0_9SPHI|nr:ABC transporter permease [Mucilaginibacter gotjawali]MBB3056873.1 ABC-type antimicrobial peptide transport system permease subunit [Mucilaginibacter gotjawali]BAU55953.1 Macrolide export ATP-binding/permease protein MacB [Mucilaginibacter gotjawali]